MRGRLASLLAVLLAAAVGGCAPPPAADAETVVVVHGLGRTPASMSLLEHRLASAGYRVVSFGYASRSEPLEALVEQLAEAVSTCCGDDPGHVHFVAHSMGGVLVRSYLADRPAPHLGRVVMLGPPSQGSELIDALGDSPVLRRLIGPAGAELGTDADGIARSLGPVDFPLGIIAGDRSVNPLASWLIPGPDDGKVAVARARADGAADFLVLPATHTFMMNREDVAEETIRFLATGRFGAGPR